jgi:hypothetical protein
MEGQMKLAKFSKMAKERYDDSYPAYVYVLVGQMRNGGMLVKVGHSTSPLSRISAHYHIFNDVCREMISTMLLPFFTVEQARRAESAIQRPLRDKWRAANGSAEWFFLPSNATRPEREEFTSTILEAVSKNKVVAEWPIDEACLLLPGGPGRGEFTDEQFDLEEIIKSKDGSAIISVRIPESFALRIRQIAKQFGISEAEAKKAMLYRGAQAFLLDGEKIETEFTTKVVAVLPSDLA